MPLWAPCKERQSRLYHAEPLARSILRLLQQCYCQATGVVVVVLGVGLQ